MRNLILLFSLILAACASGPTAQRAMPQFAYKQYPPVMLNVASISVNESYVSPAQSPNVEHLLPQPLPQSVSNWAHSRFQTKGADGNLVITIKDASMVQKDLQRTDGVKGMFTVDQAERYEAKISIEFSVDGMAMNGTSNGHVDVTRSQTVPENASLEDRDRIWNRMVEGMILDLDANTLKMLQSKMPMLMN